MIKIISGWSEKGGSTFAFINLTNALNERGYDTIFYGPHKWHLDKCKSGILTQDFFSSINNSDNLIFHFLTLNDRPNAKKVILSCHEKDLFRVGKIKNYWDEIVFINERQRLYHNDYNGKFSIIPNLKENLKPSNKAGLDKIAGIIGSFDPNKQVHVSIIRALNDGCEKVYLFGEPRIGDPYYENMVKPLLSDKVILNGFVNDKQSMYDMIGRVYNSSISEVATLVKDECETTGTKFIGTDSTTTPVSTLTNDEVIKKWVNLLEL
jgi:hypothetical protein